MMIGNNKGTNETWQRIPEGTVGAEIGVWMGKSSKKFLQSKPKHLYLVDPWSSDWLTTLPEDKRKLAKEKYSTKLVKSDTKEAWAQYYDSVYESVNDQYDHLPNCSVHRVKSLDWIAQFKASGEILDWIYVDGDHSYQGALNDLNAALDIVKSGGIIFADDYGNKHDVTKAIEKFSKERDIKFEVFAKNQVQFNVP